MWKQSDVSVSNSAHAHTSRILVEFLLRLSRQNFTSELLSSFDDLVFFVSIC